MPLTAAGADPCAPLEVEEMRAAYLALGAPFEGGVLIACSGGPDSLALLGLSAQITNELGGVSAATIDHGLRPEARAEAEMVAAFCAARGIPHAILPWIGEKPRRGVQEKARAARRSLLAAHAVARGLSHVAFAHTRDDQAETILFRMARGSGLSGLSGMAAKSPLDAGVTLLRPLLAVPKARLVATCAARNWPAVLDPSNVDAAFARVRWRALMPLLAAEGLDAERMSQLSVRLARADAALAIRAEALYREHVRDGPEGGVRVAGEALTQEPEEIALRLFAAALCRAGMGEVRLARLETLVAAVRATLGTGKPLRRSIGAGIVNVTRGAVIITRAPPRHRGRPKRGASATENQSVREEG